MLLQGVMGVMGAIGCICFMFFLLATVTAIGPLALIGAICYPWHGEIEILQMGVAYFLSGFIGIIGMVLASVLEDI